MTSSHPVPAKLAINADTQAKLHAWQDSIKKEALDIMQVKIPEKVSPSLAGPLPSCFLTRAFDHLQILSLNERIRKMNTDSKDNFVKDLYYYPEALGTDVTVTYPPADAEEAESSKKRKVGPSGSSSKKATAINGDVSLGDGDMDSSYSSSAHVFRGQVRACEYLTNSFDELRKEWDDIVGYMDAIKMFINLQFPKIEDGDTFGQSVQEEVLGEVVRSQDSAYNLLHTPANYFGVRGDLAAKVVRFPGVEDYAHALREHDRRVFYRIRLQYNDMRNTYSVVLDLLVKNMEKIAKPKSGNQMGSYG